MAAIPARLEPNRKALGPMERILASWGKGLPWDLDDEGTAG
jgi:hypothetical protein